MGTHVSQIEQIYALLGGSLAGLGPANNARTWTDSEGDTTFEAGDPVTAGSLTGVYQGALTVTLAAGGTIQMPVVFEDIFYRVLLPDGSSVSDFIFPTFANETALLNALDTTTALPVCFAEGTRIARPQGNTAVEVLGIGDDILTAGGGLAIVKWVGRQTLQKFRHGARMQPVRIRAGALGDGLPQSDLTVTADHGMVIDGYVINASALVNGSTVDFVPMAELKDSFTVYHIETEHHDVILANGAPSETFIDAAGRSAFDNHAEYLDLYGTERIIPEMDRPRISSRRLVPQSIKSKLDQPGKGLPSRHNRLIA